MRKENPIEVVIFDLDDTLMDTWGQLVRPAAREACAAMIAAGLNADLEACIRERERLFRAWPRKDVYALLVEHFGCRIAGRPSRSRVRDAGVRTYFQREVPADIRLFDGVRSMLERLKATHGLYLVTSGNPATQAQKVAHLNLAPFFREVVLVDSAGGGRKEHAFARILEEEKLPGNQVLAVGDRVDREIRAAKQLGMRACRVHHGEFSHLHPNGPEETPDVLIKNILDLEHILRKN